ncbi:MAG TPA: MFS transporter, partial [Burkholderiales bacterium]|nr:MFS transporter [Burkholderiales bacterium]
MSTRPRASTFAPFQVPSFRFQWPADLATSFAFEMENLILSWYVLVETGSVTMLTIYASLAYLGTLLAPVFGVVGDRMGHRNLLAAMRGVYAACATSLMVLAFTGLLSPAWVMGIACIMGLVRPSDIGMRAALVSETMPSERMLGAMGIQRTTQDMSKVFGSLT